MSSPGKTKSMIPPRSKWKEQSEAMLKTLGGSSRQRRKLRSAIDILEKSDGRVKSSNINASEKKQAIAFYTYVLGLIDEKIAKEKSKPPVEKKRKRGRPKKKRGPGRPRTKRPYSDEESAVESVENDCQSSVSSILDEEAFLNQHNSLCEVCGNGGKLLCCGTCNLVFHLECVRPAMNEYPTSPWSCAYCIAAGSQGDKKESRARKRASQAVREMTKLSHEKRKEKEDSTSLVMTNSRSKSTSDSVPQSPNDSKEGGEEYTDPQGVTTKQKKDSAPSCDAEDGEKRNLLYKKAHLLYDTLTPKDIGSPKSRTRRVRKQPTLYDPQTCSASEWTDSKKRLADSRNNMDENDNNNTMSKTSENEKCCEVRKVKNGASALIKYTDTNTSRTANITSAKSNPSALWCYYCKDSNIVCLFCACRVCYSKHDEKNILICDSCDEEYHIYCLDPPLTTVPKDKWFCPTCKKSDECSKDVKKVESEEPTIKVKPSPPAGTLPLKRSTRKLSQQVKCTNSEQQKHPTNERLKSNDDETDEISLSKLFRDSSKLKKDGNEKKRKAPTSPNTQKEKKLQRPSSSHSTPPLQKSRSGRTVKPQIFFDEMAEREQDQLLKSNHTQKSNSDEQQHQKKKKKSIATSPRPADAPRRGRPPKNLKPLQSDRMVTTTVGAPKQQTLTHAKSSAQIPIKPTDGASSAQDNKTSSLSGAISGSRKIPTPSTSKPSSSSIIKEDTPLVHDVPGKNVVQKPVDLNNNNVSHQTPAASRPQITTVTSPESNGIPVPDHNSHINPVHTNVSTPQAEHYSTPTKDPPISMATISTPKSESSTPGQQIGKIPRRKPGARECMQISRRWGVQVISPKYMDTLLNYCTRGKVEHLIRMRERLDEHSLMLESQLSGLQALIAEHGGADIELFGDRNLNGEGSLSSEFTVTPVSNIHENVTHENSNGSSVATNPQAQAQITSESQRLTPSHPHSQP